MNFIRLHRISAFIVFLISLVVLIMTMAPTVSFWDCGEFIAAAVTMSIPHPPGAPTFQLIGRMFSLLPFSADVGYRLNMLSVVSSALTVLFTYLMSMRLLRMWHGDPEGTGSAITMILASAAGALMLSFSDTFWFNGVETEMYGIGMFFISLVVWLALEWYTKSGRFASSNTLLLIAFLLGLSIGVHLLTVLAAFFVFALMYFRDRDSSMITGFTVMIAIGASIIGFSLMYPIMVKTIPSILGSGFGRIVVVLVVVGLAALALAKSLKTVVRFTALAIFLAIVGYSTYALVIIRANDNPPLNENNPSTFERLYSYLNRDQYGGYPLLRGPNYDEGLKNINQQREKFLPRRWNPESVEAYKKYGSDFSYFLQFQFGHIYLRYFLWNFVGRAGDLQDAPAVFLSAPDKDWSDSEGYPNTYFAIPFLLGLIGLWYHFTKDRRTGLSTLFLFLVMGLGLVVYFNMAEPQVRERDYFFVGSFYIFALWAGLGIHAIVEMLVHGKMKMPQLGVPVAALLVILGPGNMLIQNFPTHNRSTNYVAYDYAYNLLQSCDKDAILFTGGDNDTFPLWCLQFAYGVRRDVRVVNLELLNTDWCGIQLKNDEPFGAKRIRFSPEFTDERLLRMQPAEWQTTTISVPLDPARFDRRGMKDMAEIAQVPTPTSFSFTVEPTFTDPYGLKGLRIQDVLALEIVRSNLQDRPIYFAMTTAPGDHLGLRNNMLLQGFAYRVTPFTFPNKSNRYYNAVDVAKITRQVKNTRSVPSEGPAEGFMFRELDNPHVNLDEASSRMLMSYRYLFMGLAQAAHQDLNSTQAPAEILKRMDEVIPSRIHSMDMMLKTDLVSLQSMIGNTEAVKVLASEVEVYYRQQILEDPTGKNADRNPYATLLNLYDALGAYDKAINLLEEARKQYPGDPSIDQQIMLYRARKAGTPQAADTSKSK